MSPLVCMKTGCHPAQVTLKLYFKWGITFDEEHPYSVEEHGNRKVAYADREELRDAILEKYPKKKAFSSFEEDNYERFDGQNETTLHKKRYSKAAFYATKGRTSRFNEVNNDDENDVQVVETEYEIDTPIDEIENETQIIDNFDKERDENERTYQFEDEDDEFDPLNDDEDE